MSDNNTEYPPLTFKIKKRQSTGSSYPSHQVPPPTTAPGSSSSPYLKEGSPPIIHKNPFQNVNSNSSNSGGDNTTSTTTNFNSNIESFRSPYQKEVDMYSNPFGNTSSRGTDASPTGEQNREFEEVKNSFNLQHYHPHFETPPPKPILKILPRVQTGEKKEVKQAKQTKSLEEKELDYLKTKAEIFGLPFENNNNNNSLKSSSSPSGDSNPNPNPNNINNNSSTNNNNIYKQKQKSKKEFINKPQQQIRQPLGPDPSLGNGFRGKNNKQ